MNFSKTFMLTPFPSDAAEQRYERWKKEHSPRFAQTQNVLNPPALQGFLHGTIRVKLVIVMSPCQTLHWRFPKVPAILYFVKNYVPVAADIFFFFRKAWINVAPICS